VNLRTLTTIAILCLCCTVYVTSSTVAIGSPPSDWPQWRGPQRNGISQETGLLKQWGRFFNPGGGWNANLPNEQPRYGE
jgi:hypothetical protein